MSSIERLVPQMSLSDERTLWEAQRMLVRSCMKRRGIDFTFPSWESAQGKEAAAERVYQAASSERKAFANPGWAKEYGYGMNASAIQLAGEKHLGPETGASLDTQTDEALYGAPGAAEGRIDLPGGQGTVTYSKSGCFYDAQRALYGDYGAWLQSWYSMNGLTADLHKRALADPAVGAALQKWRSCMGSKGWNGFQEQGDAFQKVYQAYRSKSDDARDLEFSIAPADAQCTVDSGYPAALAQAEKKVSDKASKQLQSTIVSHLSARKRAIERAGATLSAAN